MARITTATFRNRKGSGLPISMLTAYDYPTAQIVDDAGVDAILVGDSCANTVMGLPDTLRMTMDAMVHHTAMVSRAVKHALVIADMPFMSYQASSDDAVRNAGRLMAEGGAQAVKLEGSLARVGRSLRAILNAGIPVMGHLGLMPQSVHQVGGYKLQATDDSAAEELAHEAAALAEVGCFGIVLEKVPAHVADHVTRVTPVPTIGIGAGKGCDGQVLVLHDMLGLGLRARHVKQYADLRQVMHDAVSQYVNDVQQGAFPGAEHSYEPARDTAQR